MDDLIKLKSALQIGDRNVIEEFQKKKKKKTPLNQRFTDIELLNTDELANSLLPSDSPFGDAAQLKACKATGNGNCLFNSVSCILSGTEEYATNLRILASCELFLNAELFISHSKLEEALLDPQFMTKSRNNAMTMLFSSDDILLQSTGSACSLSQLYLEAIQTEANMTCTDKHWSCLLTIMALASMMKCNVWSVYPEVNLGMRPLFNGAVAPSTTD